ncbi:MAG TPA: hypothetical protein VHI13_05470 [Candidatus Kapabacteria bacterium]|nr:hypothetical protein [Candidatus Kapabacteria bacterium]
MMKQIRNLGVVAFLMIMIVGCSNSVVDSAGSNATAKYDAYDATVVSETLLATYDEVPSVETVLLADSIAADSAACSHDSLRGGEPGRGGRAGHDARGHGRDGGIGEIAPLGIRNYRAAAAQLGLSAAQDSTLRADLADLRTCAGDAAASYRTARQTAFAQFKPAVDSIRAAVKAGTLTHDAARAQLDSIRTAFEAAIAPLNEQLRTEAAACRSTFETAVEAMLTPQQLQLWLTLK